MSAVLDPMPVQESQTKEPELWCGLSDAAGREFWWPGYARRPLAVGISWEIPPELQRGDVIGMTKDTPFGWHGPFDWAIPVVGILYFNPDGSATGAGGSFGMVREVVPGDAITITSINRLP